jgi:hypothetical protein
MSFLHVGSPVAREDGRYYVPVLRNEPSGELSKIVLRIASDAFVEVEDAIDFADELIRVWNENAS